MTHGTYHPTEYHLTIWRRNFQAAIEMGLWTLPEGKTVDDVLADFEWTNATSSFPRGTQILGDTDFETVELAAQVVYDQDAPGEKGYVRTLG